MCATSGCKWGVIVSHVILKGRPLYGNRYFLVDEITQIAVEINIILIAVVVGTRLFTFEYNLYICLSAGKKALNFALPKAYNSIPLHMSWMVC